MGPHSIDIFADNYNSQLPRFNSRFACPGSEAVNAFTVDWGGGENNWRCPLPGLVVRVVRHAEVCHATGTLIVPYWESAPFWPLLCPGGSEYAPFVVDFRVLPAITLQGRSGGNLFSECRPSDYLPCEWGFNRALVKDCVTLTSMGHNGCRGQCCVALTECIFCSKRPGRPMFDLGVKWNQGGQVNDGWTAWPRRVVMESGHVGCVNWP